jgi:hypothetical protein
MIQWSKVTWYSKILTIFVFIGVFPAWVFYIGIQYANTLDSAYSASFDIASQPVLKSPNHASANEVTAPSVQSTSGVIGQVVIGPHCETIGSDSGSGCEDKAFQTNLYVYDTTRIFAEDKTTKNGSFKIQLRPGSYLISNIKPAFDDTKSYVTVDHFQQPFQVTENKYTNLRVKIDAQQ